MDLDTFITTVYCLIDDCLHAQPQKLRQRGPAPQLADSEVLTVEVVGEFLGLETDRAIYAHFRRYHAALFPRLATVHRTTFVRQAANLWLVWLVKRWLWQQLAAQVPQDPRLSILDSVPVPVCRFARARRCRLFAGEAAFGYDELLRQTSYGFRAHLRIAWPGVITALELAPANASDLGVAPELLTGVSGWALADRNYWSPTLRAALALTGLRLLTPTRTKAYENRHGIAPWPRWLIGMRRRIETVLGQLVERFHAKRVWARDRWHLTARWLRKVLSHTVAMLLTQEVGLAPLTFAELLTA